ncbi:hypothetical protein AYO44_16675 [Planctomycetaceae bacterium SCGC AG-212-F19]|nr:hypothetical protein AYO44_16675 [Planctomycetaceae bacterium SCGC AG-212-F19]
MKRMGIPGLVMGGIFALGAGSLGLLFLGPQDEMRAWLLAVWFGLIGVFCGLICGFIFAVAGDEPIPAIGPAGIGGGVDTTTDGLVGKMPATECAGTHWSAFSSRTQSASWSFPVLANS